MILDLFLMQPLLFTLPHLKILCRSAAIASLCFTSCLQFWVPLDTIFLFLLYTIISITLNVSLMQSLSSLQFHPNQPHGQTPMVVYTMELKFAPMVSTVSAILRFIWML